MKSQGHARENNCDILTRDIFSSHIIFVFYFRNVEDEEEESPSDCLQQAEANGSDNYNKKVSSLYDD